MPFAQLLNLFIPSPFIMVPYILIKDKSPNHQYISKEMYRRPKKVLISRG